MVKVKNDLTGMTFERLTVLKQVEDYVSPNGIRQSRWLCECSCPAHTKIEVVGGSLVSGKTRSCGCLQKEKVSQIVKKENKRFSILRVFRLKKLNVNIETGVEYYFPIAFIQKVANIFLLTVKLKRKKIENKLWLTDGDRLKISLNSVVYFNLYTILCSILKSLKEKIVLCQTKVKKSTI